MRACRRAARASDMFSTTPTSALVGLQGDRAGPLGHLGGGLLRGGDDEDLGVREELGERDRDVAGARAGGRAAARRGRPSRRRRGTAAAPGAASGRARRPAGCPGLNMPIEMTFTPCAVGRHDHVVDLGRAAVDAEHARDRVAVDVGVDDADLAGPAAAMRGGEVDRHRGLADAALAGGDRVHARQRAGLGEGDLALGLRRRAAAAAGSARCSSLMTSSSTSTAVTPSTRRRRR